MQNLFRTSVSIVCFNHGHDVAVQWDPTGDKYGGDTGLVVEVDGEVVAAAPAWYAAIDSGCQPPRAAGH